MRLLALAICCLAFTAFADEQFHRATIVDAGQDSDLSVGLFGGISNRNGNTLTVELDGIRYTVDYQTILPGGKNASSRFVVGSTVQALVHKGKWLWIQREDGKTLKARITRREKLR